MLLVVVESGIGGNQGQVGLSDMTRKYHSINICFIIILHHNTVFKAQYKMTSATLSLLLKIDLILIS